MSDPAQQDLLVLVADNDARDVLDVLLGTRAAALGTKVLDFDTLRIAGTRDPDVYRRAHDYVRGMWKDYRRAIIIFDHEGSGAETTAVEELEAELEARLRRNGWSEDSVAAVAIHPELEAWVWGQLEALAESWHTTAEDLRRELAPFGLDGQGKVRRPKEALRAIHHRHTGRPVSGANLVSMARARGRLDDCRDRAFRKFLRVLREWFPAEQPEPPSLLFPAPSPLSPAAQCSTLGGWARPPLLRRSRSTSTAFLICGSRPSR